MLLLVLKARVRIFGKSALVEFDGQIYSLGKRGRRRDKAPVADNNPQQGKSDEEPLVQVDDSS